MAWKCYKKSSPDNSPVLSNGSKCRFDTLDHVWGYFAIDNENVQREFEQFMTQGRYGITEIPAEEFHRDFVEKKKALGGRALRPLWREEVAPRQFSADTTAPVPKGDAVAVDSHKGLPIPETRPMPSGVPVAEVSEIQALSGGPTPAEFKPPTIKRAKVKPGKK